jgi:hypothetical protein
MSCAHICMQFPPQHHGPGSRYPLTLLRPNCVTCAQRTQCRDFVRHVHATWCLAWRCAGYRDCVGAEWMGAWGGHFNLGMKDGEGTRTSSSRTRRAHCKFRDNGDAVWNYGVEWRCLAADVAWVNLPAYPERCVVYGVP